MTTDIKAISASIGATKPIEDRIRMIVAMTEKTAMIKASHIFVSEYMSDTDEEKKRIYESVFLFSEGNLYEAKNFLHSMQCDYFKLENFFYWEVEYLNFEDIDAPTEKSKINLNISSGGMSMSAKFHATGDNCKYLIELLQTQMIPKIST